MRKASILMIFGLAMTVLGINQAMAIPSADLRVIVIDSAGGGFGNGMTYLVNPDTGHTTPIDNTSDIEFAERITAFDGLVYVADSKRISRINLDSAGLPDPPSPSNNVISITGDIFDSLTAITVDGNGILYVADSNLIYTVDPSTPLPASNAPVPIDHAFTKIRDMTIVDNKLYIFDVGAAEGEIYVVDLSSIPSPDYTADLIYEGITDQSLLDSWGIAAHDDNVYVAGTFDSSFGPGILKIDALTSASVEFSNNTNNDLSFPYALVIDPIGRDLYVSDQVTDSNDTPKIFRLSLDDLPLSDPIFAASNFLELPSGLAIITLGDSPPDASFSITKDANVTSIQPGQGVLYTIQATNTGEAPATGITIRDDFPNSGNAQIESVLINDNLSYTSTVYDVSSGTSTQIGTCERVGDQFRVDCVGFGTLDVGDYIVVELEGVVRPGASGEAINVATVSNADAFAFDDISIQINPAIIFSTVSKTSTPNSIVAGDGSIDYEIIIDNSAAGTSNAQGVIVTDLLPIGTANVQITFEPLSNSCQIEYNPDTSAVLTCGPYTINNNDSIKIRYTVTVGANAQNPFTNNLSVTCESCATTQTDSTSTTVIKDTDLYIEKQPNANFVIAGQDSLLYTITVANDGTSDADNVVITDDLPAGITFTQNGSSEECVYDSESHRVVCALVNPIPPGEQYIVTINGTVNPDTIGPIENSASVTTSSNDSDPTNNHTTSDPVDVGQTTDVTITKTGPANTVAGRTITYDLSITNSGPSTAANVRVQDELPLGLSFLNHVTDPLTDPACELELGLVVCTFGDVGPGVTQTKSIRAQIALTVTDEIENIAEVLTDTEELDPDNNISRFTTTIDPPFCGRTETDFDSVIIGTEGNDHLKGTNGDDLILGLGGNDKIHGKNGNDCIIGGDGDDKIWGGKGDDTIEGNAGNDQLHGQQGNDTIIGGDGDDKIWGGQGNDTIDAGNGNNKVHGNQGNDIITAGNGNDWINAGNGNDLVNAGAGADKIFGGPGHDNLFGESGNDIIHGGQGNDLLNGGADTDKCHGAQGTNTYVDCELQVPVNYEDEEVEPEEDENDNGNHGNGNNNGNHGNGNNGNNGNHGNGNDKDDNKGKGKNK